MWRLLHDLLILLYYLLQLSMLLHYSLILKSNPVMGVLLPLSCCRLQLLQSQILLRVIRRFNIELQKKANTINKGKLLLSEKNTLGHYIFYRNFLTVPYFITLFQCFSHPQLLEG